MNDTTHTLEGQIEFCSRYAAHTGFTMLIQYTPSTNTWCGFPLESMLIFTVPNRTDAICYPDGKVTRRHEGMTAQEEYQEASDRG